MGPVQRTAADGDHNADDQGTHAPDIESSLDLEDDSDEYSAGNQLPLPLLLRGQREEGSHTVSERMCERADTVLRGRYSTQQQ